MPGNAIQHEGEDLGRDGGGPRQKPVWSRIGERLSFGATLAGVAAVAIFLGWLLGQYAIQSVTGPRVTTDPVERPHQTDALAPVPPIADNVGGPSSSSQTMTPTPSSGPSRPTPTTGQPASTSTPVTPTAPVTSGTTPTRPATTPTSSGASPGPSAPAAGTSGSGQGASGVPSSSPTTPRPAEQTQRTGSGSSGTAGPTGGLWRVQAGAFSERERADSMAAQLHAKGFEAFVSSGSPYRVQVGAFGDEARARAVVDQLHSNGFEAIVVPPN